MSAFITQIKEGLTTIVNVLATFDSVADVLDVLLVAIIIYALITQLRKTQSIQIIKGVLLISVVYMIVSYLGMVTSQYIFDQMFSNLLLIIIVLFNTEIRQMLEHVGQSRFSRLPLFNTSAADAEVTDAINATCRACAAMSREKTGSLIIFQRNTLLGDLTKAGVSIDSVTTAEMLCSIFFPNAALHDGAIVISKGRIIAARCIVPLKNDKEVLENVGTRHRAAMEVSRSSDAVAVVTSEETGIISIAVDGELTRGITDSELREKLTELLISRDDSDKPTTISGKVSRFVKRGKKPEK